MEINGIMQMLWSKHQNIKKVMEGLKFFGPELTEKQVRKELDESIQKSIKSLYEAGCCRQSIAEDLGISYKIICHKLKAMGFGAYENKKQVPEEPATRNAGMIDLDNSVEALEEYEKEERAEMDAIEAIRAHTRALNDNTKAIKDHTRAIWAYYRKGDQLELAQ